MFIKMLINQEFYLSKLDQDIKILNIMDKNIEGLLDLTHFNFLTELYCSNNRITGLIIPNSVRILDCSNNQITFIHFINYRMKYLNCKNNKIKKISYPLSLRPKKFSKHYTHIDIYSSFKKNITFPNNLLKLSLGQRFIQTQINFPKSLVELTLHMSKFNLLDNLPCSLKILRLTNKFDQSVNYLPCSLVKISFYEHPTFYIVSKFNQTIDNLPNSVKYLGLNNIFNYTINNLPDSIVKISFVAGSVFNHTFKKLPISLEHLVLGNNYDTKINNYEYLHSKKYFTPLKI